MMYTLIQTARLNDVDPQAWLADVLVASPITNQPCRAVAMALGCRDGAS